MVPGDVRKADEPRLRKLSERRERRKGRKSVNAERFREVMSNFATGVTVVTGVDADGSPVGFTANAVASVSLDPLLVLFCADRASASLPVLLRTGFFAVSVLRAEDEEIARRFADDIRDERFRRLELKSVVEDLPILKNALAWMACRVWRSVEAGDHAILIGEVIECDARPQGEPLVFFRGRFGTLADLHGGGE
jgi:3-hydroxy-9,10-secoandrosta-1,3,5(10)-triene-9,17-dione monooxygenase reductase component